MSTRSDRDIMRFLHEEVSPAALRKWRKVPMVVSPGDGFSGYLRDSIVKYPGEILKPNALPNLVPSIEHLPWEEFIIDLTAGVDFVNLETDPSSPGKGRPVLLRILTPAALEKQRAVFPWFTDAPIDIPKSSVFMEDWNVWQSYLDEFGRKNCLREPNVFTTDLTNPWSMDGFVRSHSVDTVGLSPEIVKSKDRYEATMCYVAVVFLAYLSVCEEYMVERRQILPVTRQKKAAKTNESKPWLREDLPHIILIDPGKVNDYRSVPSGSAHASPRPHQRRGHWRVLSADRYREKRKVRVRQAWIGDPEWQCDGQSYKVLPLRTPP